MTSDEFDELQRTAQALRTGLRLEREQAHFTPITLDEVATRPRRPHPTRWLGAGVGVAAAAAAIVLLVASLPGRMPIAATPAPQLSGQAATWQPVSSPPLAPRYGALTAWVDGSYLIVGGYADPPCTASDCPPVAAPRTDGARYHPETDTWQPIADAPLPITIPSREYPRVAVVDDKVYLDGPHGEGLLAYRAGTDHWERLRMSSEKAESLFALAEPVEAPTPTPAPPVPDGDPLLIGGPDSVLACFGYDAERADYSDGCWLLRLR